MLTTPPSPPTAGARHFGLRCALAAGLLALTGACSRDAGPPPPDSAPAPHGWVVADDRASAEAGAALLRQGGSAMDAVIAAQAVAGLIAPHRTGFGAGGALLYYDAASGRVLAYDGAPAAPAAFRPGAFEAQRVMMDDVRASGLSVGAPLLVDMLVLAHERHGVQDWTDVLAPARDAAQDPQTLSASLAMAAAEAAGLLAQEPGARDLLLTPSGAAKPAGARFANPAYARTLRQLAANPQALYTGPAAAAMVAAVQARAPRGVLTGRDLARLRARATTGLCTPVDTLSVCGMGPPGRNGVTAAQVFAIADHHGFDAGGPADMDNWALWLGAQRLAQADTARFLGDPGAVRMPVAGLLSPAYLSAQAARIDPHGPADAHNMAPGDPWPFDAGVTTAGPPPLRMATRLSPPSEDGDAVRRARQRLADQQAGAAILAADSTGNVAILTTHLGAPFGSGRMAGGFFLNASLVDFAPAARAGHGRLSPNAGGPGRRPVHGGGGVLVLGGDGDVVAAAGGGGTTVALQAILAVARWDLDAPTAARLPLVTTADGIVMVEAGAPLSRRIAGVLNARGFDAQLTDDLRGTHILHNQGDGVWLAVADPRGASVVAEP